MRACTCVSVCCMDLRTNSYYFPIQHQLIGFYKRDGVCLLRGTTFFLNERQSVFIRKGLVRYSALMSGLVHLEATTMLLVLATIFCDKLLTSDDKRFSTRREIFSEGIRPHNKPEYNSSK